jgi:hypothetical protein
MITQLASIAAVSLAVLAMFAFGVGTTAINLFDRDRSRGFPITRRRLARRKP